MRAQGSCMRQLVHGTLALVESLPPLLLSYLPSRRRHASAGSLPAAGGGRGRPSAGAGSHPALRSLRLPHLPPSGRRGRFGDSCCSELGFPTRRPPAAAWLHQRRPPLARHCSPTAPAPSPTTPRAGSSLGRPRSARAGLPATSGPATRLVSGGSAWAGAVPPGLPCLPAPAACSPFANLPPPWHLLPAEVSRLRWHLLPAQVRPGHRWARRPGLGWFEYGRRAAPRISIAAGGCAPAAGGPGAPPPACQAAPLPHTQACRPDWRRLHQVRVWTRRPGRAGGQCAGSASRHMEEQAAGAVGRGCAQRGQMHGGKLQAASRALGPQRNMRTAPHTRHVTPPPQPLLPVARSLTACRTPASGCTTSATGVCFGFVGLPTRGQLHGGIVLHETGLAVKPCAAPGAHGGPPVLRHPPFAPPHPRRAGPSWSRSCPAGPGSPCAASRR